MNYSPNNKYVPESNNRQNNKKSGGSGILGLIILGLFVLSSRLDSDEFPVSFVLLVGVFVAFIVYAVVTATKKNTKNVMTKSFGTKGIDAAFMKRILKTVPGKVSTISGHICANSILCRSVSRTMAITANSDQSAAQRHLRFVSPPHGGHSHTSGTISAKSGSVMSSTGDAPWLSNKGTSVSGSSAAQIMMNTKRLTSAATGAVSHDFFEVMRFMTVLYHIHETDSMASIARFALAAISGSTTTLGDMSRNASRRFSSVVFFMFGQSVISSTGQKVFPGFSVLSR